MKNIVNIDSKEIINAKRNSASIEDLIKIEYSKLVEDIWERRPEKVYDSEVAYFVRCGPDRFICTGSYKYFYASSHVGIVSTFDEVDYPLAIGAHGLLAPNSEWFVSFKGHDMVEKIPGGIMDAEDLLKEAIDPVATCVREIAEETGLAIPRDRFFNEKFWYDHDRPHVFVTLEARVELDAIQHMIVKKTFDEDDFISVSLRLREDPTLDSSCLSKAAWASLL